MATAFNGSSDYLVGLNSLLLVAEDVLTFAGWVKRANTTSGTYGIISGGTGAGALRLGTTDHLEFLSEYTALICTGTGTIADTNWHHVAATKNGATVHLYVDGVEGTGAVSNATLTPNGARHVHLGCEFSTADATGLVNYWNGSLAELAVFGRALNADEVAALAKGASPMLLRPVYYFPMIREPTAGEVRGLMDGVGTGGSGTTAGADHPPVVRGAAPLVGKFRGVTGPPGPPVFRPATLVRRDRRRGNGKPKPAPRLVRQTKGLLTEQLFASLSAWSSEGNWAVDSTRPTYVPHTSPLTVIAGGAIGTADGSGPREGHLMQRPTKPDGTPGRWYLFYDAGNGNDSGAGSAWMVQAAYSDDRGITWTKGGLLTLSGNPGWGTPLSKCMGGFVYRHADGQFRFHALESPTVSQGIPAQPYHAGIYKGPALDGTWSFLREPVALGTGVEFDVLAVCIAWLENVGGTYHVYYSALDSTGNPDNLTVGHASAADPDGPYTKDGLSGFTSTATTGGTVGVRPENPKKWWAPDLGKYVLISNGTGSGQAEVNICHYSDSETDFRGASVYEFGIQWREFPWDGDRTLAYLPGSGNHAIGLLGPYCDEGGRPLRDPISGHVPFTFDAEPPATFNGSANTPGYHRGRKIRQGVLEPAAKAAQYTPPDATRRNVVLPLTHADFAAEFTLECSGTGDVGFKYRLAATTASDTINGYYAQISLSDNKLNLYKIAGGSYVNIGSTAGMAWPKSYDTKNLTIIRIKLLVVGSHHQIFIASDTATLDVTDSTYASGSAVALAASTAARIYNLRLRSSDDVTVRGCPPGATVRLRGVGGVPFVSGSAGSDGNAALTNVHYPLHEIEVDGHPCAVPDGIYGGDTYQYVT